jgi:hypothetical protein
MLGLSLSPRLALDLALVCRVCRKHINHRQADEDAITCAMLGRVPYAQCPSCRQIVSDATMADRNYRRRVRAFEKRHAS